MKAPDHFKAYAVKPVVIQRQVTLQGQFDDRARTAMLSALVRFANPVDKNGEGILDKQAHLTWYRMHGMIEPKREVTSINQFGEQALVLGQPRVFLAPAHKREEGSEFPEKLDHFKCYEVLQGEAVNQKAKLTDQFLQTLMVVDRPQFFCVPVEKRHSDQLFKIQNKEDHLTIYNLTRPIRVSDQFAPPAIQQLDVLEDTLLLVPSKKKLPDNGAGLDHFRFYATSTEQIEAQPTVLGQFDDQGKDIPLGTLTHFATPVNKNDEGIRDKNAHLTFYRFQQPQEEPVRQVRVTNQFGDQTLLIRQASAFLAPAEKAEPGSQFPEDLDHFKCYDVVQAEPINRQVTLIDQFPPQHEVQVGEPRFFCVPVLKRHNNQIFDIQNEKAHLTIYQTTATPSVGMSRSVKDQFMGREINIMRGVWLSVPTIKISFEVGG